MCAIPALLKIALAPALAGWADAAPESRRPLAAWSCFGGSAVCVLSAAVAMLLASGSPQSFSTSAATVALFAAGDVLSQIGISPFWSLHHASQPVPLKPCSIALVNAVGNLGGFVGPTVLGAMHDRLGPPCAGGARSCISSWGWGTAVLAASYLLVTLCCRRAWDHLHRDAPAAAAVRVPLQAHTQKLSPLPLRGHTRGAAFSAHEDHGSFDLESVPLTP